mmetsp:Transcript_21146/g.37674  ORF Transcript_21146/g.37674 Transcript_21146/m.37674 type:complete len:276 (-) Transcript_21146:46-873(-)
MRFVNCAITLSSTLAQPSRLRLVRDAMPPSFAHPALVTSKQPLRLTCVSAGSVDRLSTPTSLSPLVRAKHSACSCCRMERMEMLPESVLINVPSRLREVRPLKAAATASIRSSTVMPSGSFRLRSPWHTTLCSSSCCFRLSAGCSTTRLRSRTANAGNSSVTVAAWSCVGVRQETVTPCAFRQCLQVIRTTRTSCQDSIPMISRRTGTGRCAQDCPCSSSSLAPFTPAVAKPETAVGASELRLVSTAETAACASLPVVSLSSSKGAALPVALLLA